MDVRLLGSPAVVHRRGLTLACVTIVGCAALLIVRHGQKRRRAVAVREAEDWTLEAFHGARYAGPAPEDMSDEQRRIYQDVIRSRPRTGDKGPFRQWLINPSLADSAQRLGAICRYGTSLDPALSELAILMTAEHHRCALEWRIHESEARRAGLAEGIIDAAREGREECGTRDPRSCALYRFVRELLAHSRVGDETYSLAEHHLGHKGVVELTAILGYYSFVALSLNAEQTQG